MIIICHCNQKDKWFKRHEAEMEEAPDPESQKIPITFANMLAPFGGLLLGAMIAFVVCLGEKFAHFKKETIKE